MMYNSNKVRFELMRRLGHFITESSEHNAEYNARISLLMGKDDRSINIRCRLMNISAAAMASSTNSTA